MDARPLPEWFQIPRLLEELKARYKAKEDAKQLLRSDKTFRHYPSSASIIMPDGGVEGECLRKIFYRHNEFAVTNPSDFSNYLRREFGTLLGTGIETELSAIAKLKFRAEVPLRTVYSPLTKEFSLRLDGLIDENGIAGGCEIKTTSSRSLQYGKKEGGGPKKSYSMQIADYFATNPKLLWFSLLVFARDTGYCVEYHYTLGSDGLYCEGIYPKEAKIRLAWLDYGRMTTRRLIVEKHLAEKTVPPRDFKVVYRGGQIVDKRTKNGVDYKSHYMCLNYCDYRDFCWSQPGAKEDAVKVPGVIDGQ